MAELLLGAVVDIKPDDVPLKARGLVEARQGIGSQTAEEVARFTESLRSTLYPGWRNYDRYSEGELPEDLYPTYNVFCETPVQALVARALAPDRVVVNIVRSEDLHTIETESINPLARRLRNVNPRYWSAGNVALRCFSLESFMISSVAYSNGNPECGAQLATIGTVLGIASLVSSVVRSGYLPHIEFSLGRNQNNRPAIS